MLLAQTLEELGCRVEEAGTGQGALRKFADTGEALSAAIVDLGLPDQPGDEVIARMRSARPHLPIVLATGYVDQTLRQRWSGCIPVPDPRKAISAKRGQGCTRGRRHPRAADACDLTRAEPCFHVRLPSSRHEVASSTKSGHRFSGRFTRSTLNQPGMAPRCC